MLTTNAKQRKILGALESMYDIVERRNVKQVIVSSRATMISNGMADIPGGGEVVDAGCEATGGDSAPAASDDDDGGDDDGEPARRRSKKQPPTFRPSLLGFAPLSHDVGMGRSRIYALISQGEFPAPIKIGKSSRWVTAEIDTWIKQQAAQRTGA